MSESQMIVAETVACHRPDILSRQGGALVTRFGDLVRKEGDRVTMNELTAMRAVHQHTNVPIPIVKDAKFDGRHGKSWIDAESLDFLWPCLPDRLKERICNQTWELLQAIRQIPKPLEYCKYYQCGADGTASHDVLIAPILANDHKPLTSDDDLRQRIHERYLLYNGRRYEHELPSMLPHSENPVFTHGDIGPRNILIADDEENPIAAIIDWETAGWYPEYWEYANIMRPANDYDWQEWMDRTAPQTWDISGLTAARRVLF